MFTSLLYSVQDNIATITLNRPDVYNAFNDALSYELQDALKQAEKDATVRVVVLTGAGKAFCSGQDLKASPEGDKRNLGDSLHKRYNPIIRSMRNMPKPVICKLNGVAAGAGCSLALACDLIVAAENASLIEIFINIALVLDSGSSYRAPSAITGRLNLPPRPPNSVPRRPCKWAYSTRLCLWKNWMPLWPRKPRFTRRPPPKPSPC